MADLTSFQEVKYNGFFIEGACYVLAFDMLQDKTSCDQNLPWIKTCLRCLQSMLPKDKSSPVQTPALIAAIERMVRSAIPDFQLDVQLAELSGPADASQDRLAPSTDIPMMNNQAGGDMGPTHLYQSMPFGFDVNRPLATKSPSIVTSEDQIDLTTADIGWDIDFATMDMEAFLSIDANQDVNFNTSSLSSFLSE